MFASRMEDLFEVRLFVSILTARAIDENCAGVACVARRYNERNDYNDRLGPIIEDPMDVSGKFSEGRFRRESNPRARPEQHMFRKSPARGVVHATDRGFVSASAQNSRPIDSAIPTL
jgi:hypothetical protein